MKILVFAALKYTCFGLFISHPYSKVNTDSWCYSGTLPYAPLEMEFWNMAVIHQLAYLLISTRLLESINFSPSGDSFWRILIWCVRISYSPLTLKVSDLMVNTRNQITIQGSKVKLFKLYIFYCCFLQTSNANSTHGVNIWMPFLIKQASTFSAFCASLIK